MANFYPLRNGKNVLRSIVIFLSLRALFFCSAAQAQTFTAAGFSQVLVVNGISNPTVMAFAPDGRLFVAQQNGALRIIENGVLLATPAITLSVNSSGERGLLGIAFDPDFNNNRFIYLYYTLSSGANNRISRFTISGNTIALSSELVVLNLDPLSGATNHNGGTIQFGPDGKLYVGVGENANSANSQNLDTYHGKILRINSNGSVSPGNPFTSGTAQRQRVWEYGMRNPYTLSIQPGTGRIFVNDVGEGTREEVNDCTTGGLNYGWPSAEGTSSNPAYINPTYSYSHGSGIGIGCAITGGTFFNPTSTNYPSQYTGRYFFLDYCNRWIDMLTLNGSTATRSNFASSIAGSPVGMATGPDGNLYFLSRANGAVYKITFTGSSAPVITNQPQNTTVSEGNQASLSVTATGASPLNYQWRKNSVNISGATNSTYTIPSVVPADAGNYSVVVSNSAGSVISNNAALAVTPANQVPIATINTPAAGATFAGGDIIHFSGSGADPEDGTMAGTAFEWYTVLHHDAHVHPGPAAPSGVTSGSFSIPNSGEHSENIFFRLYLVVTDSQGGRDTSFTDIIPRTSTITINTKPQGLQITLDGQPFTAPKTVTSVEGMLRTIGAPSPQEIYTFNNWSQGGSATQTFATPVDDAIYTANYSAPDITPPAVASVIPANNTTGVNDSTTVIANFSEALNPSSVTTSTFQLKDDSNNIVAATVSATSGQIILTPLSPLKSGTVYTATITGGPSGVKDLAGNVLATDYSWSFITAPAVTYTIFSPGSSGINQLAQPREVGVKFRVTQPGFITGIRFYKGAANTGTHTGHLWSNTGTSLASVTFTGETASGWQEALFASPVAVSPGITYIASYFTPTGNHAITTNFFTSAVVNGPLRALAGSEEGGNGVFGNSAEPVFPNTPSSLLSNFWVDVVFTTGGTDVTPPSVSSVTPGNATTGVSVDTPIIANFNEAVDSSTVTTSTFQLKDFGNNIVTATVSVASGQITLTPLSPLDSGTVYTATIIGGASGVKDLAGNALASDYSWSFITARAVTYNIFSPANSDPDQSAPPREVGVKFQVTQSGFITGIRFYKGVNNTGTHTGHLWSNTGTSLASVTFTGETASGWQQALFASPVAVTPGVTYIASYFTPTGNHAITINFFTSAVVNGPLRALAGSEEGGNGVFGNSAEPVFPNTPSSLLSNFWVDVVFTTGIINNSNRLMTNNNSRLITQQSSLVPGDKKTSAQKLGVKLAPNPSADFFKLIVVSDDKASIKVRITDISGRVLEHYGKVTAGSLIEVGKSLRVGTYFAEVIQGDQRKVVKIIKVN